METNEIPPDETLSQTREMSGNTNDITATAEEQQKDSVSPPPAPRIKQEMSDTVSEEDVVMQDAQQQQQQEEASAENNNGQASADDDTTGQQDVAMEQEEEQQEENGEYQIVEPDYTAANKIRFAMLCGIMEKLWQVKKDREYMPNDEKLNKLLPKKLLARLNGVIPYPILRLIMPQIDTARPNLGMQEKTIASSWSKALGLGQNDSERLSNYSDPIRNKAKVVADLSLVVEDIVSERYSKKSSNATIGQVNDLLDDLEAIRTGRTGGPRNHDWRDGETNNRNAASERQTTAQRRADWVRSLIRFRMSPLEHKWIVRILLGKVELGVGHNQILNYLSPYAKDLYNANTSLKRVCATLSDKEWIRRRKERDEREALERQQDMWNDYMPRSGATFTLTKEFAPMLANRSTFESAMTDIERRHRKFAEGLSEAEDDEQRKFVDSLALKFPTFICEIKMDGERMLVHVKRGNVTMHTRRSRWYSNLYGPCLAPAVRQAIAKYDVDVILDGEVISWDNGRQEVIPFGTNRSVAGDRRKWLRKHGQIEERDLKHHEGDQDTNVMGTGAWEGKTYSTPGDSEAIGAQCWLQYIVFDVIYVGGPDAARLVSESTGMSGDDVRTGSSIMNLSGFDRKNILYRLIDPQPLFVELMPSLVVRRDGQSENAVDYFSPSSPCMESGTRIPCSTADSFQCLVRGGVPDWEDMDKKARGSKTDKEISALRVAGMNKFYVEIVENRGLEGLIFKDLLAPYVLGEASRNLRYWNKMKPDYSTDGHSASDIDGVVLGAYYATGMAKAGMLNAFLIGCVDEANPGHYMTLCKVNGGSINSKKRDAAFEHTGFRRDDHEGVISFGKWFRESNHGKSIPDFISSRSFQTMDETDDGWKCQAKKYPDLWIQPDDSFVVSLNCGEITTSDEFSSGVSLRFPRIEKVRLKDADEGEKPANEADTREKLYELFSEMELKRSDAANGVDTGSDANVGAARFLTTDENAAAKKKSKQRKAAAKKASSLPVVEKKDSAALAGVTFVVLEGSYSLDEKSLDAEQAKVEGWFDGAQKVKTRRDVLEFISRHGGTYKVALSSDTDVVLGGQVDDARVVTHTRMLDSDEPPGKNDTATIRLRELGGIVKWTYVFSSVRRWIDEASQVKVENFEEGPRSRQQLALGGPPTIPNTQLARPSRHDYLVLGKSARLDDEGAVFGIQLWKKDIDIFDLKRGLEEVQRNKRYELEDRLDDRKRLKNQLSNVATSEEALVPWQYAAVDSLEASDRWIVAGDIENLWNFRRPIGDDSHPTVIYPDLFDNDFGLDSSDDVLEEVASMDVTTRWDDLSEEAQMSNLASCLPLARTMGGQVTPHLHSGVTHVLCLLKGCETTFWQADSFQPEVFVDQERAMKLHRRLLALHDEEDDEVVVKFVSPNWVRAQFDGTVVV